MRLQMRLLVADLASMRAFYRDVLGLTVEFDDGDHYVQLRAEDSAIGLFHRDAMRESLRGPAATAQSDRAMLVFGVDDVDLVARRLRASGVRVVTAPKDMTEWGVRIAHFRDPEGNLFEINQPLG